MRTVPYCVGCRVDPALHAAIMRRVRPGVRASDVIRLALTCYLWEDLSAAVHARDGANKKPRSTLLRG